MQPMKKHLNHMGTVFEHFIFRFRIFLFCSAIFCDPFFRNGLPFRNLVSAFLSIGYVLNSLFEYFFLKKKDPNFQMPLFCCFFHSKISLETNILFWAFFRNSLRIPIYWVLSSKRLRKHFCFISCMLQPRIYHLITCSYFKLKPN